jgi:hypothetical protein
MDIPDKFIDKMIYDSGNSSENLFKQAGNSIVVAPLYHIFRKMFVDRGPDKGQSYNLF